MDILLSLWNFAFGAVGLAVALALMMICIAAVMCFIGLIVGAAFKLYAFEPMLGIFAGFILVGIWIALGIS